MPTYDSLPPAESSRYSESDLPELMPAIEWPVERAGFRGTLDQIGLASILWILEMERKAGILVLILEPGLEKAHLHLSEGRVFRAHMENKGEPRNAELVYTLLGRTRGTFDFQPSGVVPDDELKCSTTRLILEGARRLDEARRPPP